jgi:hypothetical protein
MRRAEDAADASGRSSDNPKEADACDGARTKVHTLAQWITPLQQCDQAAGQRLDYCDFHGQAKILDACRKSSAVIEQRSGPVSEYGQAMA